MVVVRCQASDRPITQSDFNSTDSRMPFLQLGRCLLDITFVYVYQSIVKNYSLGMTQRGKNQMLSDIITLEEADHIASIMAAAAIIFAAWKWREEKRFEWKLEHATRIMTAAYRVQQTVQEIRRAFVSQYEIEKAENVMREKNFSEAIIQSRRRTVETFAFLNRLHTAEVEKVHKELYDCMPAARVIFGNEFGIHLSGLCSIFSSLNATADSIIRFDDGTIDVDAIDRPLLYPNRMKKLDPTKTEVDGYIKQIEKRCLPVIRKKRGWI